jgi:hypothetical protein
MSEFHTANLKELTPKYWEGRENILIRLWIYTQRGLGMVNEWKYLVAGIMAGYVILKFTNPLWMLVIGAISLPILILLGRWQLHKVAKVSEWVGVQHGSVLGYNSYNLQVRTLETLEAILKKLSIAKDKNIA